jgi:chaperonin GroES
MSITNLTPLYDKVLVEPMEDNNVTSGGIIIPDTAKEKPSRGLVKAVGAGSKNENGTISPLTVKVGDVVMFSKWGGTEVKVSGKDLLIVKESDILAIVN